MLNTSSSGMAGVTTAIPEAASCRASDTSRGSSMPAACRPETSSTVRRAAARGRVEAGAHRPYALPGIRRGVRGRVTARAPMSAIRRATPCMSAARTTNDRPRANGRASSPPTATSAECDAEQTPASAHEAHVTLRRRGIGDCGIRDSRGDSCHSCDPNPKSRPPDPTCGSSGHRHRRAVGCREGNGRADRIAAELGYRHVDSGAMYRAVGWKALRGGLVLDDEDAVARLAAARASRSPAPRCRSTARTSRGRSERRKSIAPQPLSPAAAGSRNPGRSPASDGRRAAAS